MVRPLAKAKICDFLLVEYDRGLPGDDPKMTPTIEHILPRSYKAGSEWAKRFSSEEHEALKDTLANVIPLSSPMNSSLQAARYEKKRERYLKESAFTSARALAERWDDWTPDSIFGRSRVLGDWMVQRWPEAPE